MACLSMYCVRPGTNWMWLQLVYSTSRREDLCGGPECFEEIVWLLSDEYRTNERFFRMPKNPIFCKYLRRMWAASNLKCVPCNIGHLRLRPARTSAAWHRWPFLHCWLIDNSHNPLCPTQRWEFVVSSSNKRLLERFPGIIHPLRLKMRSPGTFFGWSKGLQMITANSFTPLH